MLQFSGRHERTRALMHPYRTQAHTLNFNYFGVAQAHTCTHTAPSVVVAVHSSADGWCSVEDPSSGRFQTRDFSLLSSRPWVSKRSSVSHFTLFLPLLSSRIFISLPFSFSFFSFCLGRPSLRGQKLMSCTGATVALCSCTLMSYHRNCVTKQGSLIS